MRTIPSVAASPIAVLTLVIAIVASALPLVAQELPLLPPPAAFATPKAPQPFGNLFGRVREREAQRRPAPSPPAPLGTPAAKRAEQTPAIACPMRLVPVDPAFDRSMRHTVDAKAATFTMRVAPPLACRP
jgi:hypothetical protein